MCPAAFEDQRFRGQYALAATKRLRGVADDLLLGSQARTRRQRQDQRSQGNYSSFHRVFLRISSAQFCALKTPTPGLLGADEFDLVAFRVEDQQAREYAITHGRSCLYFLRFQSFLNLVEDRCGQHDVDPALFEAALCS